jgi:hypothetical protein
VVARIRPQGEAGFQSAVIQYAQLMHWRVAWFRPVRVQRKNGSVHHETPVGADGKGWPDLAMCRGPRLVVAELKTDRGRFTPEQIVWLAALEAAGVEVYRWRPKDWTQIEETLR